MYQKSVHEFAQCRYQNRILRDPDSSLCFNCRRPLLLGRKTGSARSIGRVLRRWESSRVLRCWEFNGAATRAYLFLFILLLYLTESLLRLKTCLLQCLPACKQHGLCWRPTFILVSSHFTSPRTCRGLPSDRRTAIGAPHIEPRTRPNPRPTLSCPMCGVLGRPIQTPQLTLRPSRHGCRHGCGTASCHSSVRLPPFLHPHPPRPSSTTILHHPRL